MGKYNDATENGRCDVKYDCSSVGNYSKDTGNEGPYADSKKKMTKA